jgi:hypothetical protein
MARKRRNTNGAVVDLTDTLEVSNGQRGHKLDGAKGKALAAKAKKAKKMQETEHIPPMRFLPAQTRKGVDKYADALEWDAKQRNAASVLVHELYHADNATQVSWIALGVHDIDPEIVTVVKHEFDNTIRRFGVQLSQRVAGMDWNGTLADPSYYADIRGAMDSLAMAS